MTPRNKYDIERIHSWLTSEPSLDQTYKDTFLFLIDMIRDLEKRIEELENQI